MGTESFLHIMCKLLHYAPARFEIGKGSLFRRGRLSGPQSRIQNSLAAMFHGAGALSYSSPYESAEATPGSKS